jgi:hypothetical protein
MTELGAQSRHVRLFRNNRNRAAAIPVEFESPGGSVMGDATKYRAVLLLHCMRFSGRPEIPLLHDIVQRRRS